MKFELLKPSFGLEYGQVFTVLNWSPTRGCLVLVEFRGVLEVARYFGRSVELTNGTFTWLYKFIGVVQAAANEQRSAQTNDDEKNDSSPRRCRRASKQRGLAENF